MPSLRETIVASLVALAVMEQPAHAFCRKTTCPNCPTDPTTGCPFGGKPLAWPGECVSYSLQRAASRHATLAEAQTLASKAFGAWQAVRCPGTGLPPSIAATDAFGFVSCAQHEYDRNGQNANVVVFRDDSWPPSTEDALGMTEMSFDVANGNILDADVELNGTVNLTTTDIVPPDGYDLLSLLTHEAGHFFGLSHSSVPDATMQPDYQVGTDDFRTLSDDDVAGICAIYPPGRDAQPCDFTPHGGFSPECALGVVKGGCSLSAPRAEHSTTAGGVGGLALMLALRRRRRARLPEAP